MLNQEQANEIKTQVVDYWQNQQNYEVVNSKSENLEEDKTISNS